jgi:hypothetical protein
MTFLLMKLNNIISKLIIMIAMTQKQIDSVNSNSLGTITYISQMEYT